MPNSMSEEILDIPAAESPNQLREAVAWWEGKRLWFNAIVGGVGALGSVLFGISLAD